MLTKKPIIKFLIAAGLLTLIAAIPTSGQYNSDQTQVQVSNPAQDTLQTVNQILCIINNTQYPTFTNHGNTLAIVNQNNCQQSGNPGQQSSGSNSSVPSIFNIIYNATRASNSSPESAVIWLTGNINSGNNQSESAAIYATLTVTESANATNPYGSFDFEFAGYPLSAPGVGTPFMIGYIRSSESSDGTQNIVFYNQQGSGPSTQISQVNLVENNLANTGYGLVTLNKHGEQGGNTLYAISFNNNYVYQESASGSNQICYDRNSIESVVYQYGVYNQDGSVLTNPGGSSGYMVTLNGQNGFLSYYGLGLPGTMGLPTSGTPITYLDNSGNQQSGFLYVTGGKMTSLTAESFTLNQLTGLPISVPISNPNQPGNNNSDIIAWNITGHPNQFVKVATQVCSQQGCTSTPELPVTPYGRQQFESAGIFVNGVNPGESTGVGTINLFLNGLGNGGNTQIQLFESCSLSYNIQVPSSCRTYLAPTGSTTLTVWVNGNVAPTNSSSIDLYCTQNCPVESNGMWISANPGQNDGSGGESFSGIFVYNIPYIRYSFDPAAYALTVESAAPRYIGQVVSSTAVNAQIFSGPLLTETAFNLITNNGTHFPNMALLYSGGVNEYFQWNSGGQQLFNFYTGISTDGSIAGLLPLVAPLQLEYTDQNSNVSFLQYSGVGNLQGIPGVCKDESGNPTNNNNCGMPGTTWVPSYNIPTGSTINDLNGNNYYVKQLFVNQVMAHVSTATCTNDPGINAGIAAAIALTPPESTSFVLPSNGPMPNITTPSVIFGVVVESPPSP